MGTVQVILAVTGSSLAIIGVVLGFIYKTSRWVTKQEEENKDIRSDTAHKIEMAKVECLHCIDIEKQKMEAVKETVNKHGSAIETVTNSMTEIRLSVNTILAEFKSVVEKIDKVTHYIEGQPQYDRRKKTTNC